MRTPIRAALAVATVLALLAGCETAPTAAPTAAAVPVQNRDVVAAGATTPATAATTAGVVPQSRVTTVDLAAPRSATGATAIPLSRPPTVGAAAAAAAAEAAAASALAVPRERMIFFDFDSYVIKDDFKGLLDGQAKSLAGNRGRRMTIEGHTDERGGREYNLALGQKRAEAVLRSLTLLGVSEKQLEAVSFGEERPLEKGTDEAAWSRNRRAELKDR